MYTGGVDRAELQPPTLVRVAALTAVAFLVRLAVFPLTQDLYGDAISRTEMGRTWMSAPHWMSSFSDGAMQFGPLHLYLVGLASLIGAERFLSVIVGSLTVVPVFFLTRRLFGERAASIACLLLAFWSLHIQFSTTTASEALALFLTATTLAFFAHERWLPAALTLTLACATRYDAWLLVPLLGGVLAVRRQWRHALVFCAVSSVFPLVWMVGNWRALGDPLYPFRFVDAFHVGWFGESEAFYGPLKHRALNLFFYPLVALATLGPFVFVTRRCTWLMVVMLVPAVLLTVRATVVGNFEPAARFTARELLILIVLAAPMLRARAVAVTAAIALFLGAFTFQRESKWADALRPLSPVTSQPVDVMQLAAFIRTQRGPVAIEADPRYRDIAVAFYSGVPVIKLRDAAHPAGCTVRVGTLHCL
jgi:hypothetical protein